MNAAKVKRITEAAARKADAQLLVDNLKMSNMATDPDKRKEQVIQFCLAQAELDQASFDLSEAMKPTPPQTTYPQPVNS